MALEVQVKQRGLEASIEAAAKKAGRNLSINIGKSAKSIDTLSQPLGRITGRADEFTKSMEAANARVLAFGASVGVLTTVTKAFKDLVTTTIQVEKQLTSISTILGGTASSLSQFSSEIFKVARNTEQSFAVVADAALELSRQGLESEQVIKRLNDALILSRLTGQGAAEAVSGLTAAINSFNSTGITSSEVLNKLSSAAINAAVSERDLIEGVKRSGAVAVQAGVSFDELVGIIGAVQEKTARGGAVIGNSFKTIFTRIQSLDKLQTMQNLGVQVTNATGDVLSATQLIQNLGKALEEVPDARRLQIAENLVGKFQIAPFLAILEDFNSQQSKAIQLTGVSQNASTEAYERNITLNKTLSAAINEASVNLTELANNLGKIGVTDGLKQILDTVNGALEGLKGMFDQESGSNIAKNLVKGIGNVLSGPGVAIFLAIIGKLTFELAKFGVGSLKTFFGINKAAKEQAALQGSIASSLLNNSSIQKKILAIENSSMSAAEKKKQQTKFFTTALNEQYGIMLKMQQIAGRVAPGVMAGTRGKRGAGGYIPSMAMGSAVGSAIGQEQADINRGVGGAPRSANPVPIPNFNFGGGQRGTIVANDSEFIVPSFGGGSAIFNQNMASSMGLPRGAKQIGAAGGYIPNFAKAQVNQNKDLILFVGNRGVDEPNRSLFAGKVGNETRAYTSMPPKGVKNVKQVQVPIFKVGPKGSSKGTSRDIDDIKKGLSIAGANQAKLFAKEISGKGKLPTLTNKQIEGLFNPGAFEGFAGSVFEVSLAAILGSKQFLDYASRTTTARIDLPYSDRLFGKFGAKGIGKLGAEVKATDKTELLKSAAVKFYDVLGGAVTPAAVYDKNTRLGQMINKPDAKRLYGTDFRTYGAIKNQLPKGVDVSRGAIRDYNLRKGLKTGAGGYVPGYAGGLEAAVTREASAGLPINQIRINQSGSLRNASNPMGLAVTNMRDEPTGAIPNFSNAGFVAPNTPSASKSGFGAFDRKTIQEQKKYTQSLKESTDGNKKNTRASGDMLGKIFAVQAGLSLLSGSTADAKDGLGLFTNRLSSGLGALTTAAFAVSAVKDLGKDVEGFKGSLGRGVAGLAKFGASLFAAKAVIEMVGGIMNDLSGFTAKNNIAMEKLAQNANKAAVTLGDLSAVEKQQVTESTEDLVKILTGQRKEGFFRTMFRDFSSKEFQVEGGSAGIKTLREAILGAVGAGLSQKAILETIREGAAGGPAAISGFDGIHTIERLLDANEMNEIVDSLQGLRNSTKAVDTIFSGITDENKLTKLSAFANLQQSIQDKKELPLDPSQKIGILNNQTINNLRKLMSEQGVDTRLSQDKLLREQGLLASKKLADIKKKADEDEAARLKKIRNLRLDGQKIELNNALERRKVELTSDKAITKRIANAETLGNITKEQLIALKTQKFEEELQNKIILKRFDILSKSLEKVKGITAEDTKAIQERILKLDAEEIKSKEVIRDIMSDILGITGSTETEISIAAENFMKANNAAVSLQETVNQIDRGMRSSTDSAQLLSIELKKAQDRSTSRSADRAFFESQNIARKNVTDRDAISRLRQQMVGAQPEVIARIENRIMSLEAGIAARVPTTTNAALISKIQNEGAATIVGEGVTTQTAEANRNKLFNATTAREALNALANIAGESDLAMEKLGNVFTKLENEVTAEEESAKATAEAAALAAQALNSFEKAVADANAEVIQSSRMGIASEEAANARRAAAIAANPQLTPGNASRLSDLQRTVAQRFRESPDFDPLLQADILADSITNASLTFKNNISDALVDAISKGESLKDTLLSAASGFFDQMSRALMNNAINSMLTPSLGAGGSGGFLGGLFGFNTGGRVSGGSGVRDDVPALLTGGEFVMNKKAVQNYGAGFMGALNSGAVPKYANGGLFTPGTYGQGSIKGSSNLLNFATQSYTGGMQDQFLAGAGVAGLALEPQSGRLTMLGRSKSPAFQKEQDSKRKAFDLFAQQYSKDAERRKQKEQNSGKLLGSILGFGFSLGANALFGGAGLSTIFSKGKATGGAIPYSAGVDSVPAMLSGGEFVMNAAATQRLGAGNLAALNSGGGVASGDNSQIVGKLDQLNETIASSNTEINITVNSNGTENTDSPNAPQQQRNLATRIKDVVRQVIDDEKRLGGSLRMA